LEAEVLKFSSKIVGGVAPWLPIAIKLAPWVMLAAAVGIAGVERLQLDTARDNVTVAQYRTTAAISECKLDAQTAAQQNAQTPQFVQQAEAQHNAAEQASQAAQVAAQAEAVMTDKAVTNDAAKPGSDAKSAPVLLTYPRP
jgi:hypothetical protein